MPLNDDKGLEQARLELLSLARGRTLVGVGLPNKVASLGITTEMLSDNSTTLEEVTESGSSLQRLALVHLNLDTSAIYHLSLSYKL